MDFDNVGGLNVVCTKMYEVNLICVSIIDYSLHEDQISFYHFYQKWLIMQNMGW
jgi:hypothetical protein